MFHVHEFQIMDIEKIMTEGIVFKGSKSTSVGKKDEKVKTKAKKKAYITGAHGCKLPILGCPLLDGRQ